VVALTPTIDPPPVDTARIRTEPALCCLCGNEPSRTVARRRDFEYDTSNDEWRMDRCDSCGVSILNPRPIEYEFHRVYPPHYHAFQFDEKHRTIVSPVNWVYSIRNWLVYRQWPNWLVNQFSLAKPIPLAAFTILDYVLCLFNRGALLQGVFVKPQKGYSS